MSTSSDATKKKDAVWQEAGEEFYQESYPSGSAQNNCRQSQRRTSRHNFPLPSQTARRNSYALGRRRTRGRDRDRDGVNAFTYTSTMAVGTTANDIHVAVMPDLADLSIPNERKRWEELHKIKSMPIPMAQKRELKAQLTTIPMLKLKGWKRLKWKHKRFTDAFSASWSHHTRGIVFWQSSLRNIEVRCGTSIVNVFFFIKWTLFLNITISAIIFAFLILPYFISGVSESSTEHCPEDFDRTVVYENMSDLELSICCSTEYYNINNISSQAGVISSIVRLFEDGAYDLTPLFYGYYQAHDIIYPLHYNYAMAYALVTITIFAFCFVLMVRQVGQGIKELILAGEGEFYKYCNLIFAGWDHCTRDDAGAKFKKKILRHEMKLALQTEKLEVQKTLRSRKQRWKLIANRFFCNVLVICLQAAVGYLVFKVSEFTIQNTIDRPNTPKEILIGFLPSIVIGLVNIVYSPILRHIGKLEKYSPEFQTALILIRALFVRLMSIAFIAGRFYTAQYCPIVDGTCAKCEESEQKSIDERPPCWESLFAEQIYKIIVMDLLIKIVIVFFIDFIRLGIGRFIPGNICKKIGTLKFDIVRHSLDIVYIQTLSWLGFYFAPFMPIVVCIYCVIIFYLKKFQVLVTCQAVPDTFRTTRTTTMFVSTKLISFTVVTLVMGLVIGYVEPSKGCGPFRDVKSAWLAIEEHLPDKSTAPVLEAILEKAGSPAVTTPIAIILFLLTYYYYAVAQANRSMVETLRHLLILEGHDKQYLFARLNTMRRQSETSTLRTGTVIDD